MKRIKFRSWVKSESKMLYDFTMLYNNKTSCEEEYTLMQYIGIIDENLNKIYEGDTVEVISASLQGITFRGEVKYLEQKACFVVMNDKGEWINLNDDDELRVLGNVYEGVRL